MGFRRSLCWSTWIRQWYDRLRYWGYSASISYIVTSSCCHDVGSIRKIWSLTARLLEDIGLNSRDDGMSSMSSMSSSYRRSVHTATPFWLRKNGQSSLTKKKNSWNPLCAHMYVRVFTFVKTHYESIDIIFQNLTKNIPIFDGKRTMIVQWHVKQASKQSSKTLDDEQSSIYYTTL